MGNKNKLRGQASKPQNPLAGQAGLPIRDLSPQTFCISLKHFDAQQGQSFKDWENEVLLAKLLERWHSHCQKSLEECLDKKFKRYPYFPPKSKFKHPKHVPEDAVWASMHVQGKECVAGHIVGNVFYVVFLDKEHDFWPTELKNT